MTTKPEQFAGGTHLGGESCAEECSNRPFFVPNAQRSAIGGAQDRGLGVARLSGRRESGDSAVSSTTNCVTLPVKDEKGLSVRVVGIELNVESWVKNVLVPALLDEFIEKNGEPR